MIHNLKALGVVLVAAFVLSAVAASTATAQNGTLTSDGPAKLAITQTGSAGQSALTVLFSGTLTRFECFESSYTGSSIPNDISSFTVVPDYRTCLGTPNWPFPTTVDMNGCDYIFNLEATKVDGSDEYPVRFVVKCPVGKHITMKLFSNAESHTNNKPYCHLTILEEAAGYAGLTAKDTTNGLVDTTGTVEGIKAEGNSGVFCSFEAAASVKLHFDITLEGKNEAGARTSIGISHL